MNRPTSLPERFCLYCRRGQILRFITLIWLLPGLLFWTPVYSNPTGGVVVHGDVSMVGGAGNLTITQNSQSAIINWNDFSIDVGELTQFVQPGASSAVLNRVTGGNPSAIHGALKANGSVFVINPNGILVGPTGTIDVHGLVLSTLDISDGEFLAGGDMVFKGDSDAGITNMGRINGIGGDVFLIGKTITNTGSISASGTVGLGAGEEVLLTAPDGSMGERVFVRSTGSGASGTGVLNDGTIEGATVELKAHGNLYALAINNKGSVRATGVENFGGKVFLRGVGGTVENTGSIAATTTNPAATASVILEAAYARAGGFMSATDGDGSGGTVRLSGSTQVEVTGGIDAVGSRAAGGDIVVEGDEVIIGSTASVDASGVSGGGTVRIGGGFQGSDAEVTNSNRTVVERGSLILADVTEEGDAGSVILWSDDETVFEGDVSAAARGEVGNGGLVEVSGKSSLLLGGAVDTMGGFVSGRNGTLLIDPSDFLIQNGTGVVGANAIRAVELGTLLNSNHVIIATTAGGTGVHAGVDDGDILVEVNANVLWGSSNSLTLLAYQDVEIRANILNAGDGAINIAAGWDPVNGPITGALDASAVTSGVDPTVEFRANVMSDPTAFGQNGGMVRIGESFTNDYDIEKSFVGSRDGETNLVAYGVEMTAGQNWRDATQIGWHDQGVRDNANQGEFGRWEASLLDVHYADDDYAENTAWWGTGPALDERGTGASGNIEIRLLNDLTMAKKSNPTAGDGRSYAQIGHGGANENGDSDGGDMTGSITIVAGLNGTGNITIANESVDSRVSTEDYMQIGHGGLNNEGSHSGAITINSSSGTEGNLILKAGQGYRQSAMIGHGGLFADGAAKGGDITIDVAGRVEVSGGASGSRYVHNWGSTGAFRAAERNFAQIGHGGHGTDATITGEISVTAGGDISFEAGKPTDEVTFGNFAQLGHGGYESRGQTTGGIEVIGGGALSFTAGHRFAHAQLGHGGYESDGLKSGAISVDVDGDIAFQGGLGTRASEIRAFAQLGHGGYSATGAHNGDITVESDGFIRFAAGQLSNNYTQLGHGGRSARSASDTAGNSGDIDVSAETGISFIAGTMLDRTTANGFLGQDILDNNTSGIFTQTEANTINGEEGVFTDGLLFAMLGHGGYDADASVDNARNDGVGHSGDIRVASTMGDITFNGAGVAGQGANASAGSETQGRIGFALLGHGGAATVGDHSGAINVNASAGSVVFNGGNQLADGGINNVNGDLVLVDDQTDLYNFAQLGHGGAGNQWGNGSVAGRFSANSAGGTLGLNDGIEVSAGNAVNFTAGQGRRSYAMLGLGGYEGRGVQDGAIDHQGNITVNAGAGGVNFLAGTNSFGSLNSSVANNDNHGRESFAYLGHGGFDSDGTFRGDISVTTTGGGNVRFVGGNRVDNFVQLGHGGRNAQSGGSGVAGGNEGDITVNSGGGIEFIAGTYTEIVDTDENARIYAQLGHGGYDSDAFVGGANVAGSGHRGDIALTAGGDFNVIGGDVANGSHGGGQGRLHYAQVGHGGAFSGGDHQGSINVTATGAGQILGGSSQDNDRNSENYALVGHGGRGYNWSATSVNQGDLSSINLGGNTALDGVNVTVGNGLSVIGGDHRSYAQIGLAGMEYDGTHEGGVSAITTGGDILVQAGAEDATHAMIGNGGRDVDGDISGDIRVTSAGTLRAIGGPGSSVAWNTGTNQAHESPAHIGHGGHYASGEKTGNIIVRVTDHFELLAGENGAFRNSAQIGHGGYQAYGAASGLVSVSAGAGTSRMIASQATDPVASDSYVQIGHGGVDVDGGDKRGNIEVLITNGGNLDLVSGASGAGGNAYAMIGNGGTALLGTEEVSGNITAIIDGELSIVRNSAQSQIAHRGLLSRQPGDLDSDLTVLAGTIDNDVNATNDLIRITDNTGEGQIQNVWIRPYLEDGSNVPTNIGDVTFGTFGTGSVDYSDVDFDYSSTKDLTLTAGGDLFFMKRIRNQEQTGGGDLNAVGNWGGTVGQVQFNLANDEAVTSGFNMSAILTDAATANPTWAGANSGNVVVGQNFAGAGNNGQVQIGSSTGATSVLGHDVRVVAGGDGGGNQRFAQIGVNDNGAASGHTGAINVFAINDVEIRGGTTGGPGFEDGFQVAYGMIGHGGVWSSGRLPELSGDITVDAGRNILAVSGTNEYNYTQIGHGGAAGFSSTDPTGKIFGDIAVSARTGSIQFTAGTGFRAQSQIGHGGRDTDPEDLDSSNPDESSDISVSAAGDIAFHAGTGAVNPTGQTGRESYAMIGHGGYFSEVRTDDEGWYGDITVNSGGEIDFRAGDSRHNFVQLGHGGYGSRSGVNGAHSGDISVSAQSGINFIGGVTNAGPNGEPVDSDSRAYAQLGHGGAEADVNLSNNPVSGVGHSGDIRVITTTGDINFLGGASDRTGDLARFNMVGTDGRLSYSQLGHGGIEAKGEHSGAIEVEATAGDVNVFAGTVNDPSRTDEVHYAQIGHGGFTNNWGGGDQDIPLSANSVSGSSGLTDGISVTAGGDVNVEASDVGRSYAMIGLGGWGNDGNHEGDIAVTSGGDVTLRGGNSFENFAQIGNGGRGTFGDQSGDIEVTGTGRLDLLAGTGNDSYAMIGHGGTLGFGTPIPGTRSGDIFVSFATGIALNSSLSGGSRAIAHIGHGGFNATGNHSGFVTVVNSTSGDIVLRGGDGANDKGAQIGHRIRNTESADLSGSISVVNLGGDITLQAGNGDWRGAMIGHGDPQNGSTGGSRTGGVNVFASGAVTLTDGGGNSGSYIGHQTNSGIGSVSYAGSGINAVGDSGFSIVAGNGFTAGVDQINGTGNAISMGESIGAALAAGNVTIASGGTSDLDLNAINTASGNAISGAVGSFNSSNDVTFAAGGDLLIGFNLQNAGDGNITLIGGWSGASGIVAAPQMDPLTLNPFFDPGSGLLLGTIALPDFEQAIPLPASCLEYAVGNNGDIVLGDAAQTSALRIGSRSGTTSVFGHSVTMNAGTAVDSATQIGFFTDGSAPVDGEIQVAVHEGGLAMNSGSGAGAYTMIGHGGSGASDDVIAADITISFCEPASLDMNANGDGAFAQIGHGVQGGTSGLDGNISAIGFNALTMDGGNGLGAYAMIGHGGNLSSAGVTDASLTLTGASLDGAGGSGDGSFVMIGHGGLNETRNATNDGASGIFAEATRSGDINVTLTGDFDLDGGGGQSSFVQVGHGGRRNNAVAGQGHSGNITISSRSFDIFGGGGAESFGMAGHGGYQTTGNHSGDISITTTGPNSEFGRLRLRPDTAGNDDADRAFTQIGHGGYDADFDTASDFSADRYVDNRASNLSGNITLDVAENVVVVAVASNAAGEAYSQVGHGGFDTTGSFGVVNDTIQVTAGGTVLVQGGQTGPTADTVGRGNYAQIGHGGAVNIATGTAPQEPIADPSLNAAANGSHTADITINAASVNVDAGIDNESYAQIGHGGINSGNGGAHTGDVSVMTSTGNIRLQGGPGGGFASHAQIGHGGRNANGNHSGNITLNSGQDVFIDNSGASDAFSLIGHGGLNSNGNFGSAAQNINVTAARNVLLEAGPTNSFAMIGLGGRNSDGNHTINDINVTATTGFVSLLGTTATGDNAFTQIGLGGHLTDGTKTANSINVTANGADASGNGVSVLASNRSVGHAMIGNGGVTANGSSFTGDITVQSNAGSVLVQASDTGNQSFAMIGHGGRYDRNAGSFEVGDMTGNIVVSALGASSDLTVDGGGGTSFAQIGLGGFQAGFATSPLGSPTFNGTINVEAGRDVLLQGGVAVNPANSNGYAQIGHGGRDSDAVKTGQIDIDFGRNLSVLGGGTQLDVDRIEQHAQIGHGGRNGSGAINGDILINQDGGAGAGFVLLRGGDSDRSYSQIGHGGHFHRGDIGQTAGAITLTTAGNIDVTGGSDQETYAQIGHGGDSADAAGTGFNGAVTVTSTAGNITLSSNPTDVTIGNRASSRIGHGGLNNNDATGDFTGNIAVTATAGSVLLDAGSAGSNAGVDIGHGGINARAANTHSGTINVTAGTTITLNGGGAGTGELRNAQIGHGGEGNSGDFLGAITLGAGGDIALNGGDALRSSALVGHGGRNADGAKDGAITVNSGGTVTLTAGAANQSFAQIGHGGEDASGVIGANEVANIIVDAATGVNVAGNQNVTGSSYTQIGHGGLRAGAATQTIAGTINVSTDAGDILLSGSNGGTGEAYTQIGHGGLAATYDVADQRIDVEATTGAITMTGSASQNQVMIGHGGERSTGDLSGYINVLGQNAITLTGGRNVNAMTQIGHGGSDHSGGAAGTLGGEIQVRSVDSSVSLSTAGSTSIGNAVQIGHGGYQNALSTTTITGHICVIAGTTAEVNASGGGLEGSYAMIGHGGVRLAGDVTGDITVTTGASASGTGGITLTGGNDAVGNEFAQIGHGGIDSNGTLSGDIYAIADNSGTITLQGGTGNSSNYAMIGHGDGEGNTSSGQREGGIHLFTGAPNGLSVTNGAGLENTNIWHQTNGGLIAADYLGGDGFQILQDLNTLSAQSAVDIGELTVMTEGNFGAGSITVITSADTDLVFDGAGAGDIFVNSSDDFFLVTGGNITFANSYQNAGTGNVTIVAGWNGQGNRPPATVEYAVISPGVFNYCEPTIRESGVEIDFNDCDTFGNDIQISDGMGGFTSNGPGSITLGSADQDNPVYVGSRLGRTIAAGYGLTLNGGDTAGAATQLGFHNGSVVGSTGSSTGAIDVYVKGGGVTLNGGSEISTFAQIGHGGTGAVDDVINSALTISFCEPGIIDLNGGGALGAYAQIGHGVTEGSAALSGAINIDGFSAATLDGGSADGTFAQIGHGGALSSAGVSSSDITLNGASLAGTGGGGNGAYVMVGHGGLNETRDAVGTAVRTGYAEATRSGAIDIDLTGDFDFVGGAGDAAFVHVGHGGRRNNAVDTEGHSGNIEIDAATIDVIGGPGAESYSMVGHGGYQTTGNHTGDVTLNSTGTVWIRGDVGGNDDADRAFAQVGHGGFDADFNTADMVAAPDINLLPYYVDNRAATLSGTLSVTSTNGDVQVRGAQSNSAQEAYGQLGHGGFDTTGSFGDSDDTITVTASNGQVSVFGGLVGAASDLSGRGSYGQIGMGGAINVSTATAFNGNIEDPNLGIAAAGSHQGDITVTSGRTVVNGGIDNESFAQIGHGGINSGSGGGHTGNIEVTGSRGGDGDVVLRGGDGGGFAAHAQIGHGGRNSDGNHNGNILVNAVRNVTFDRSGASAAFLMIGHGGHSVEGTLGTATDTISVTAGEDMFLRAGGSESFAMIGLGGFNVDGDKTLDSLTVRSGTTDANSRLWLQGNNQNSDRFSMIGLGGRASSGNFTINDLVVNSGGTIELQSGTATGATATNNTTVRGFTMIGLGGHVSGQAGGTMTVNNAFDVTANDDITLTAGGNEAFAMIGVGGFNSDANLSVDEIDVISSTGSISLLGGTTLTDGAGITTVQNDAFAQIGVGGRATEGTKSANAINVTANGADTDGFGVSVISGPVDLNYAQIGVGGHNSHTTGGVNTSVNVVSNAGGIRVVASDASNQSYAHIGHGGRYDRAQGAYALEALAGGITINAVGASSDVVIQGGGGTSYAQIGHGGYEAGRTGEGANHSGSINLDAGRDLILTGGSVVDPANSNGFALLGHGGTESDGNHSGNISVDVARNVTLTGGGDVNDLARVNQLAQIGHGGLGVAGTLDGSILINQDGGAGTGDVTLTAGVSSDSNVRIGHGGANHNGAIGSLSASDIRITTAGAVTLTGGTAGETSAVIGHGGRNHVGTIDGLIDINGTNAFTMMSGSGGRAFTQVGHGGYNHSGAIGSLFSSTISVGTSGTASITGGSEGDSYAQVGHLGSDADGDVSDESVTLTAGTGVSVIGGDIQESYAQIGHGGDSTDAGGTGMSGNVTVTTAAGDITLRANPNNDAGGNRTSAQIGHGGLNNGVVNGDFSGDIRIEATAGSVALFSSDAANNNDTHIGHGGIDADALNGHSGAITVIAGADVSVNGGNEGVGATRHSLIGHGGNGAFGDHNGNISITAGGNVDVLAGTLDTAYAQIGHGGNNVDGALSGNIEVTANGTTSTLRVLGGGVTDTPTNSSAMIGHGGLNADGTKDGQITVNVTGATTIAGRLGQIAFGQIGHGGHNTTGAIGSLLNSDISLTAGSIDLAGNQGAANTAYTQLGHGGFQAAVGGGNITGNITATATTGDILLTGSNGGSGASYVILGHAGQTSGYSATGNITVDAQAGAITIQGAASQATTQIGHGGEGSTGNFAGTIDVDAANAITLTGGANEDADVRIGHGGNASTGTKDGNIFVTSDTAGISLTGGTANDEVIAQIGHGGARSSGNIGATAGDITVAAANTAAGNVSIIGGANAATRAGAIIGHGGSDSSGTKDGDITVTGGGALTLEATGNTLNYAQVGHSSAFSNGAIGSRSANINVNFNGAVTLTGNQQGVGSAGTQIGHGGANSGDPAQTIAGNIGVISQTADIMLQGGNAGNSFTQIGHGGYSSEYDVNGTVTVESQQGALTLTASSAEAHTQIGHGGELSSGALTGTVDVDAVGAITLTGGTGDDSAAQIGHGGNGSSGSKDGNISVTSTGGAITLNGGTGGDEAVAQIGHGGARTSGNIGATAGDITVAAATTAAGNVNVNGGSASRAGALIGHGGSDGGGTKDGDISVTGGGTLGLMSNGGFLGYSQIGHSSAFSNGVIGGRTAAIDVDFNGNIGLTGNQGTGAAGTQIGHGGFNSGNGGQGATGTIDVVSRAGNVTILGATAASGESYTMIGHGGVDSDYDSSGAISVESTAGAVSLTGAGTGAGTRIGHGGKSSTGDSTGDISVLSNNAMVVQGGSAGEADTQIGHGGLDSSGSASGAVSLEVTSGNLALTSGADTGNYVLFGHGGRRAAGGSLGGDIDISLGSGNLLMNADAGGDNSFVQIGHGGADATTTLIDGHICVDVSVATAGDTGIEMTAGANVGEYVQIGHGGLNTVAAQSGSINAVVRKGGNLAMTAGADAGATATIGHGDGTAGTSSGNRSGQIDLIVEGSTVLTDGTNGGASFGHSTTTASGILAGGFGLLTETLDMSNANLSGITGTIQNMAPVGDVEFLVTGGSLDVNGPGAFYSGTGNVSLVASGSVNLMSSIQNAGSGGIDVIAGWDGTSGLTQTTDFNSCPIITDLSIDVASILANEAQYGIGGFVEIGDGSQTGPLALGSAGGKTRAVGAGVNLVASDGTLGGITQIGFNEEYYRNASSGSNAVASTGDIEVIGKGGGVNAFAGDANGSAAQIGHGGSGNSSASFTGGIAITSGSDVNIDGGDASGSFAMIGHGGDFSNALAIGGNVAVAALNDIFVVAGNGDRAFAQIGSGGAATDGDMTGNTDVAAGNNILVDGTSAFQGAHAKIGLGDDPDSGLTGTGSRDGNINVAAGANITLRNGMIGHVNADNQGTNPTSGTTQVGASRTSPTNPGGGSLRADAQSELAGPDGLRIYAPERSTNGIAAGASLNGVTYGGAQTDPSATQGANEFVVLIEDDQGLVVPVNEHNNAFGSGPAPSGAGSFAFYYNKIVLTEIPDDIIPDLPGGGVDDGTAFDPSNPDSTLPGTSVTIGQAQEALTDNLDDRTTDDWQRDMEELHTGFKFFNLFYEGFDQYGPNGEVIFNALFGSEIEVGAGEDVTEDVLRRQLQILEEQAELEGDQ